MCIKLQTPSVLMFSFCLLAACLADSNTLPSGGAPYCGIAANVFECRQEVERLRAIDLTTGDSFERMCMGYGGTHPPAHLGKVSEDRDMCTLNINNDCDHWYEESPGTWRCAQNYGISKNPDECHGQYFFLWDEPMTQGLNATWAADQWRRHVETWSTQIASMRARGTQITTPMFTDHGGPAREKMQVFFERCGSECDDPHSNYYINVLVTNQWLLNSQSQHREQEQWIKDEMSQIRQENGNRPLVLGNFAWLGASTADEQAEAIANSRIWNKSWSGLEAVFYFGAIDYGGGTTNNFLYSQTSDGSTIAAALVNRCLLPPAPTPPPTSSSPTAPPTVAPTDELPTPAPTAISPTASPTPAVVEVDFDSLQDSACMMGANALLFVIAVATLMEFA